MGEINESQLQEVLLELQGPFQWSDVFGNARPVELDVGCGKGLFLVTAAAAHPEVNFLGIDWSRRYCREAARRLVKQGVTSNARVLKADARVAVTRWVPDRSVRAVHIYFPDPWWKRRHQKRRLFNPEFVEHLVRILEPGGHVHVATDVEDYFRLIQGLLDAHRQLTFLPPPEARSPTHDMDYLTHFERKYRLEGRRIYRLHYQRLLREEGLQAPSVTPEQGL